MSDNTEQLRSILAGLAKAEGVLDAAMKPFRDAARALDDVKEEILDALGVDIAGRCETCTAILLDGDKGHRCQDGDPIFCAACAPTWGDVQEQWASGDREDNDDEDNQDDFVRAYEAHLAAGGSPDDPILHDL